MRKNRLLMSLLFALSYGSVACGGADDNSLNDTTEALKRAKLADGGAAHAHDHSADSDEAIDEASSDGGKRHEHEELGDGGHRGDKGPDDHDGFGEHDGGDCDRGGKDDDDRGGKGSDDHGKGGLPFGGVDGGFPHK